MRMTKKRIALLNELKAGARFIVTKHPEKQDKITVEGASDVFTDNVIGCCFYSLKNERRLQCVDEGLFSGCAQSYKLVE